MINELELSSNERKLLASLTLPGTLATLTRRLSTPRSTVEYNISKLLTKKIIGFSLRKKRKIYNIVDQKNIQKTLPPSHITKLGPITIYSGHKAIETLWQEVARQSKGSRLTGIQPSKSFKEAIKKSSKEVVQSVSQTITDKKFIVDSIVHGDHLRSVFNQYSGNDTKSVAKAFTGRLEDIVKVDPSFLDEKSEMFMIGNFSFFIDWFKEVAIKIENQNINHLLLSLYQATKAYGKRYEQSRDIERIIEGIK
jgi:hypothetical protein